MSRRVRAEWLATAAHDESRATSVLSPSASVCSATAVPEACSRRVARKTRSVSQASAAAAIALSRFSASNRRSSIDDAVSACGCDNLCT